MRRLLRGRALRWLAPWAVGVGAGVLALGPALGAGFVLRYDMVFVPNPPLSARVLGGGEGFPRAVPSDAVVGVLGRLLPADLVQAMLLLLVFVLGAAGAARLVPGDRLAPRLAAAVFYAWTPFLAERLLLGQWAVLLGYAGLPWVLYAAARLARFRDLPRLVVALLPAAVGGFSSVGLSALVALPVVLLRGRAGGVGGPRRGSARWRALGVARSMVLAVAALVVVSLPWLVPALGSGARTDPAAVGLFAARADTPFGAAGSLLALGGIWNARAVPLWYEHPFFGACRLALSVAALAGWVWLLRRGVAPWGRGLSLAAGVGFAVALLGTVEPGRDLLRALIAAWPGFGPLRDGQLYVAPLALLQAVGFAGAVAWLWGPAGRGRAEDGAPGEPLTSSEAATPPPTPLRSSGLWTVGPRPRRRAGTAPPAGPTRSASRAAGPIAAGLLVLAPVVLLPGLAWGAGGRLTAVGYPREWTQAQRIARADPRPGAVLVLPWSAYRGLDWAGPGRPPVVVLDPATKLFGRRVVWNDDLRVGVDGDVRVAEGEDPLARRVERAARTGADGPELLRGLGDLGIRYVLVERAAADAAGGSSGDVDAEPPGSSVGRSPDGGTEDPSRKNLFSFVLRRAEPVHRGSGLALYELPDRHVEAAPVRLTGLEVTGWLVTVGALAWSTTASGSSLVSKRPTRRAGAVSRKESSKWSRSSPPA